MSARKTPGHSRVAPESAWHRLCAPQAISHTRWQCSVQKGTGNGGAVSGAGQRERDRRFPRAVRSDRSQAGKRSARPVVSNELPAD